MAPEDHDALFSTASLLAQAGQAGKGPGPGRRGTAAAKPAASQGCCNFGCWLLLALLVYGGYVMSTKHPQKLKELKARALAIRRAATGDLEHENDKLKWDLASLRRSDRRLNTDLAGARHAEAGLEKQTKTLGGDLAQLQKALAQERRGRSVAVAAEEAANRKFMQAQKYSAELQSKLLRSQAETARELREAQTWQGKLAESEQQNKEQQRALTSSRQALQNLQGELRNEQQRRTNISKKMRYFRQQELALVQTLDATEQADKLA